MQSRTWSVCLTALWLTGCQWLPMAPEQGQEGNAPTQPEAMECYTQAPGFRDSACLLQEWVAFGLASQRADSEWRSDMLERFKGTRAEARLARAMVMAWGPVAQWKQASELLKADLHAAPSKLQPLLRYWLNELERRRDLQYRHYQVLEEQKNLEADKQALEEKLDALTDIERNINSRE
ncbi:hypothetical protein HHA01_13790 [Halomonas halmophila]|uniref:Lipoprotein n=2 Tax=Halomonas halmophila TaxID=252 RepID=A0A4Y4EWU5_9GAMM|nr:hypothetical protein HHA01_13790 [Halomonas halmophila]